MPFKRKVYNQLLTWKENYVDKYSILIEGPRRVGKSTIVEHFAKQKYKSYILIDFAHVQKDILACFDDLGDTKLFLLHLQAATGIRLFKGESVIIFDEIQLYPQARQALKYLVKDSDYHYIETRSLISIKKNLKDIVIPSEEKKLQMFPMDYEEFLWATGSSSYSMIEQFLTSRMKTGDALHRKLIRDFRIYMAVGGMPQAVEAYVNGDNFADIDKVKTEIIHLYEDDFKKIDPSGRLGDIYKSIPVQLSKNAKRFIVSQTNNGRKSPKDDENIFDLVDSKTILISHNCTDPGISLSLIKDYTSYKLYVADTELFVTMLFMDRPSVENELYAKLLADKLPANLGYLYENVVAQTIAATGRDLYYHTWEKEGSTHHYEIDFLVSNKTKINALEVKSSGTGKHKSLTDFSQKFSKNVKDLCIISQKELKTEGALRYIPVYMFPIYIQSE